MNEDKVKRNLTILASLLLLTTLSLSYLCYKTYNKLEEANIVLKSKIDDIQDFNKKLGLANSNLRRQDDLIKKYESEMGTMEAEFLALKNKYDLDIKSRDETIAKLKGGTTGGTTIVVVENQKDDQASSTEETKFTKISYQWQDPTQRFKLVDPNIFEKNNEIFEYIQYLKLKGYVFSDATGNIQVRKVAIQEVLPVTQKDGSIKYKEIKDSKVELVESEFEYSNESKRNKVFLDIFSLRPLATFDLLAIPGGKGFLPGLGVEVFNIGNLIDYANLGIYGKLALDLDNPQNGSLQSSRLGVGVNYWLTPPIINTNFSIGLSASTPLNNFGQALVTMDLIVYLTGDLNPFSTLK